jgi:hypothetical protein
VKVGMSLRLRRAGILGGEGECGEGYVVMFNCARSAAYSDGI